MSTSAAKAFSLSAMLLATLALTSEFSLANPTGANVVAGSATVQTNPADANHLLINQSTDKAIINWSQFNIGENEHTQFVQPSSSSITLNRVTGGNESQILGRLSANGRIMLVNPAGIFFGPNSRVDVAGLVATTGQISNADFLAGNYHFSQNPAFNAPIINHGTITVADTGFAALVAPGVENHGVISARLGTVVLGAASKYTMDLYGDGLLNFVINEGITSAAVRNNETLSNAIKNDGYIYADGGHVLLKANIAAGAVSNVINMRGVIQANAVTQSGGHIVLQGGKHGNTIVSGKLYAQADQPGQSGGKIEIFGGDTLIDGAYLDVSGHDAGGFIETSGINTIAFDNNFQIKASAIDGTPGTWHIDPSVLNIDAALAASIVAGLATMNVTTEALTVNLNAPIDYTGPNVDTIWRVIADVFNINATIDGRFGLNVDSRNPSFPILDVPTVHVNANIGAKTPLVFLDFLGFLRSGFAVPGPNTISANVLSADNITNASFVTIYNDLLIDAPNDGFLDLGGYDSPTPVNLTVNLGGLVRLADLGVNSPLQSLTINNGSHDISFGGSVINTIGDQTYNHTGTFSFTYGAETKTFTANQIKFGGSIQGVCNLECSNPGTFVINTTQPTLLTGGPSATLSTGIFINNGPIIIDIGAINATTSITITGEATLKSNLSLGVTGNSFGGGEEFNETPNGGGTTTTNGPGPFGSSIILSGGANNETGENYSLTLSTNGDPIYLSGNFGDKNPFSSFTINGTGALILDNATIINSGNTMVVNTPTELIGSNTITETGAGDVIFNNTIDSHPTGGPGSLVINTAGNSQFNGLIGSSNPPVQQITTDAPGTVSVNTPTVRTINGAFFNEVMDSNQSSVSFISTDTSGGSGFFFGGVNAPGTDFTINTGNFSSPSFIAGDTSIFAANSLTGSGFNVSNLSLGGNSGGNITGIVNGISGPAAAGQSSVLGGSSGSFFVNGCLAGTSCTFVTSDSTLFATRTQVISQDDYEDEEEEERPGVSNFDPFVYVEAEDPPSLYPSNSHNYLCADCDQTVAQGQDPTTLDEITGNKAPDLPKTRALKSPDVNRQKL